MKKGSFVLVGDGEGGYVVGKLTSFESDGYIVSNGYYGTFYRTEHVHACPISISKTLKEREL